MKSNADKVWWERLYTTLRMKCSDMSRWLDGIFINLSFLLTHFREKYFTTTFLGKADNLSYKNKCKLEVILQTYQYIDFFFPGFDGHGATTCFLFLQ